MQYTLTPYTENIQSSAWWRGAFSEEELDYLQDRAKSASMEAQVGGEYQSIEELHKIRRSKLNWLSNTPETEWVFERLAHVVSSLNSEFFRFDLTGFGEQLQLTNYDQENRGMYSWHQDSGGPRGICRKLSFALQLSDPSDYEGGNLQIMTRGQPENLIRERGIIVAFPSYTLHQVTPVVAGSRQSLVAWVSGPPFK